MDFRDNDFRRNSIAFIPHEIARDVADIRRKSDIVIPTRIEANCADDRRRSSAGSTPSRYLRGSIGSCHDYCKYGTVKIPKAFPKTERKRPSTANSKSSAKSFVMEKSVISVTKKGTSLIKVSSFEEEDIPTENPIHSNVKHRRFEPVKSIASYETSPEEQGAHHIGHNGTRKSYTAQEDSSSRGNKSIVNHNGKASVSGKSFSNVQDQSIPEKVESKPPSDEDVPEKIIYVIESSSANNAVESTPDSVSLPKPSPLSHVSVESESNINSNSLEHARKGIGRTGSSPSMKKETLTRTNIAHSESGGHLNQDNRSLRGTTLRGTNESVSPLSSTSSTPIISPMSTLNKINRAKSQHGASKTAEQIGKLKVQDKATPRRSAIVGSGNQNSVARKMSFQRGRVIELQPESISPRRLKFRPPSSALDVQNKKDSITGVNIRKRNIDVSVSNGDGIIKRVSNVRKEVGDRQSFSVAIRKEMIGKNKVDDDPKNGAGIKRVSILRKEVGDNQKKETKLKSPKVGMRNQMQVEVSPRKILRRKGGSSRLPNEIRSNQEKVVLKHQEVPGKKDDQKSFNNVIEETASKLVETRKSKVKALVGAFETVISLQDTKQAAKASAY